MDQPESATTNDEFDYEGLENLHIYARISVEGEGVAVAEDSDEPAGTVSACIRDSSTIEFPSHPILEDPEYSHSHTTEDGTYPANSSQPTKCQRLVSKCSTAQTIICHIPHDLWETFQLNSEHQLDSQQRQVFTSLCSLDLWQCLESVEESTLEKISFLTNGQPIALKELAANVTSAIEATSPDLRDSMAYLVCKMAQQAAEADLQDEADHPADSQNQNGGRGSTHTRGFSDSYQYMSGGSTFDSVANIRTGNNTIPRARAKPRYIPPCEPYFAQRAG